MQHDCQDWTGVVTNTSDVTSRDSIPMGLHCKIPTVGRACHVQPMTTWKLDLLHRHCRVNEHPQQLMSSWLYVTKPTGAHSWPTMKLYVKGDRSQVTYMYAEPTQPSWAYNMFSKIILIANSSNSTDGLKSVRIRSETMILLPTSHVVRHSFRARRRYLLVRRMQPLSLYCCVQPLQQR